MAGRLYAQPSTEKGVTGGIGRYILWSTDSSDTIATLTAVSNLKTFEQLTPEDKVSIVDVFVTGNATDTNNKAESWMVRGNGDSDPTAAKLNA